MNDILNFCVQHWQASLAFVLLLVGYVIFEAMQTGVGAKQVSPQQAVELFNHKHAVILDIRPKEEFAQGHILGAVQLDVDEADDKLKKLNKYSQKPIIVVCAAGKQAPKFVTRLQPQGLHAVSLAGGINAWQDAGLPLTTRT